MQFIGSRCDSREYRGDLGSQDEGSWLRFKREVGVTLSSSDRNAAFRDSRSIICDRILVRHCCDKRWAGGVRGKKNLYCRHAFFCNRTIAVHFFSSNDSYFVVVAASKTSSPRLNSALNAAAVFCRLFADRYAMIDLCLGTLS
jgi:hypothetical protein